MITWTDINELFWFQKGMMYAIACCDIGWWVGFERRILLDWWKRQMPRSVEMPAPETALELSVKYWTAFLEGVWAYVSHPQRGEERLFSLQGQIAYLQCQNLRCSCGDLEALLQDLWPEGRGTLTQREAFHRGMIAAEQCRQGEALSAFDPCPEGNNAQSAQVE